MKNLIYCLFIAVIIIAAPRGLAQTTSNSDFNPFPQMEQDQQNVDNDTAAQSQQQNDDTWPPANSDTQTNSGDNHE